MPRELTEQDTSAMKGLVRDMAGRLFIPDAGNTLGGQSVRDFLAGPAPSNPFGAMQQSIGRATCDSWARGDGSGIPPRRELMMRDTCTPYIDSIGAPPAGAAFEPPYERGQCSGVIYGLNAGASFRDYLDGVEGNSGSQPFGNIGGITFSGPVTSVGAEPRLFGTTGLPQAWRLRIVSGGGTVSLVDLNPNDLPGIGGRTERKLLSRRVQFFRISGGADDCGDPANQWDAGNPGSGIPLPSPIPSPPGFDIPFPGIDVTLNPDGTISIDFGDGGPPLTVDPGAGAPALPGADTPGPGDAGTPSETGDGGEDEGEAPEGRVLTGIKIDILDTPPDPRTFAPGVYRGVCYAYLGVPGQMDLDPAGAALRSGQFIYAETDFLTAYRVSANLGFNLRVTPYYRDKEQA